MLMSKQFAFCTFHLSIFNSSAAARSAQEWRAPLLSNPARAISGRFFASEARKKVFCNVGGGFAVLL
jgi:hypothetical protein